MIEVIWPLSTLSCSRDTVLGGKNLIGLRTFVQEVLKRSKTSYSTLQVALYYLVLVKPCIPGHDFTMEQVEDSQSLRAMQCGRRMFLAALILASKYLQDRNYSARAWSKISGLKTFEINMNEMAFLSAVNWKLHIPEPVFQRWTDVVLKYSPSAQLPALPRSSTKSSNAWKSIIPVLTPELDNLDFGSAMIYNSGSISPSEPSLPPPIARKLSSPRLSSNEQTPTIPHTIPRFLEPTPRESQTQYSRLPPLPRIGSLPTPQMTPQTSTLCTPAVSVNSLCSGRSSMSVAMVQAQSACVARTTLDSWRVAPQEAFPASCRRSSLAHSVSSFSSPESMVSDVSARSSRSSSISSVASSTCALPQPRLAVQATRRCANMQLTGIKENSRPIIRSPSDGAETSWEAFNSSPDSYPCPGQDYFKAQSQSRRSVTTYHDTSDQEAAEGLRDLALNRQRTLPQLNIQPQNRKRERPASMDFSLQQNVRDLITSRCLGDITTSNSSKNGDDGTVLQDNKLADSFLLGGNFKSPELTATLSHVRLPLAKDGTARKRACCAGEQVPSLNASMTMQRGLMTGPGMWKGIL
ncbi:hypothetical protein MMC24_003922 [Lignoscripta atroalba]|nr:hypothetical protein [Lignoscripta atroalba]